MTVSGIMRRVLYALVPAIVASIYQFGWGLLWNLLLATVTALTAEAVFLKIRQRPVIETLFDFSAVVTAVLLAFALPPYAPWWLVCLASLIAIVVAKQIYGGLGQNPFNPAMVAYAMMLISFPLAMSRWPKPLLLQSVKLNLSQSYHLVFDANPSNLPLDFVSTASPLETWRVQRGVTGDLTSLFHQPLFGHFGYAGGEWVAIAIALGGLWLLWQRIITWHIPFSLIVMVIVTAGGFYLFDPAKQFFPLSHLFLGATALGAFFIATDPVTAPASPRAQLVYGGSIGALIVLIRVWGGFPDGVAFSVLIMNMFAPLLDKLLRPRVFGTGKASL
ncbi:MAG: RnfABCDGE type electron transport complex subunit D [Gammaproteobacteria bacterium]|nr:RnfABCDGE type electron transport complex subunit D [Gammaproteobacteria bacterium]